MMRLTPYSFDILVLNNILVSHGVHPKSPNENIKVQLFMGNLHCSRFLAFCIVLASSPRRFGYSPGCISSSFHHPLFKGDTIPTFLSSLSIIDSFSSFSCDLLLRACPDSELGGQWRLVV
ncbi:hypothetical protein V2G26_017837 [Clonostachys chloroleuca]